MMIAANKTSISDKIASLRAKFAQLSASEKYARFQCLTQYSALDFNATAYTVSADKLIIYAFLNRDVVIPSEVRAALGDDIVIIKEPVKKRIPKANGK